MTTPSIHATTTEHLGPEADNLDLEAYKLAALIVRGEDYANEQWAVDQVWNHGDWVPVALATISGAYPSLGIADQATADAFTNRYSPS